MVYRRTPKTELQKLERRARILREARASIASAGFGGSKIKEIAERPTLAGLRDRLHARRAVTISLDTARLVREERETR